MKKDGRTEHKATDGLVTAEVKHLCPKEDNRFPANTFAFPLFGISLAVLLVFLVAAPAQGRTVRVGVYQNEPKVFTDKGGHPSGIFIDLLGEIAKAEEWTLVYEPGTWNEGLRALENGRIDLMPDVAYSDERNEKYSFHSTPVAESWSYVYAAPRSRITRLSQLDGKRVAVLGGSLQDTTFRRMVNGFGFNVELVTAASLEEAFRLVSDGKADGAVANHFFGDYSDLKHGLARTPIVFSPAKLYYAAARGRNADLLAALDRHLDAWLGEQGSFYYRTLNRYAAGDPARGLPWYVIWTTGVIGGLLIIAGGIILLLRWQVRAKTRHLASAVQSLRDSELEHRTLFETWIHAVLLMRHDRFVDCNARTLTLFGCGRGQIIGASLCKFSPPLQPDGWPFPKKRRLKKCNRSPHLIAQIAKAIAFSGRREGAVSPFKWAQTASVT